VSSEIIYASNACVAAPRPAHPRAINIGELGAFKKPRGIQISPDGRRVGYLIDGKVKIIDLLEPEKDFDLKLAEVRVASFAWNPDGDAMTVVTKSKSISYAWTVYSDQEKDLHKLLELKANSSWMKNSPDGKFVVLATDNDPGRPDRYPFPIEDEKPFIIDGEVFKSDRSGYIRQNGGTNLSLCEVASQTFTPLTKNQFHDASPAWSPDSEHIVFTREQYPNASYQNELRTVPRRAMPSESELLIDTPAAARTSPEWSSTGAHIAFLRKDATKGPYALQHLAIWDFDLGEESILTTELDRNVRDFRLSPDGSEIYFTFDEKGRRPLSKVNISAGDITPVVEGNVNVKEYSVSDTGEVVVLMQTWADLENLYQVTNQGLKKLTNHNDDFFDNHLLGVVSEITVPDGDGNDMTAFVTVPPVFDDTKTYPAILRIHGGPVKQREVGFDFASQYYASRGYIVVEPNPPGSTGQGQSYIEKIRGNWGCIPDPDVVKVLDHVIAGGKV